jgi:hypothetical protein
MAHPNQGLFNTRSADRPNPIGLREVEVALIDGRRVRVRNLEVLDGTPIVNVKPALNRALDPPSDRRRRDAVHPELLHLPPDLAAGDALDVGVLITDGSASRRRFLASRKLGR